MKLKQLYVLALSAFAVAAVHAQTVDVKEAWARATVPGQKATGAFMKLTAPQAVRLVGVVSPVAGVSEVHEMKMDGGVMKMRALPALDLPAGQAVELKPGGYHVMLMDLKTPLRPDSTIPLTLVLRDAQGKETRQELQVPVRTLNNAAPAEGHEHHHGMKH